MSEAAGEYAMLRTYLDWLAELPWSVATEDRIDIAEARKILDDDHYGLQKIKRRILEYLAVRKLNPQGKSPILCFVGPPGVGKTSLGQSIARATGPQVRAHQPGRRARRSRNSRPSPHLHRRPARQHHPGHAQGRHAQLRDDARRSRQAGPRLSRRSVGGAAGSARPGAERHVPRQLSRRAVRSVAGCMFICTANMLDTIPGPLRDRMEVIQLPGYTEEEKAQIARRYLVPRQLEANGLTAEQCRDHRRRARTPSSATTRAKPACAIWNAKSAACFAMPRCASPKAPRPASRSTPSDLHAILGPAEIRERSRDAHQHARRRHRPGLDSGGRRHPVHRSQPHAGQWQADPDRPARRSDEGKRAGGADAWSRHARPSCSIDRDAVREAAISTSTYRPAPSPRTGPAPAWRCSSRWPRCSPSGRCEATSQ